MAQGIITDAEAVDHGLGLECAGLVAEVGSQVQGFKAGDRVGALTTGAFTTSHIVSETLCWAVPEGMSLEEAASIPVTYGTVIHGMVDRGNLEKGMVREPFPGGFSRDQANCVLPERTDPFRRWWCGHRSYTSSTNARSRGM